jgi:anti-sigma factor RsiW
MRDETVDPRIDKMVAALYGELSESEERAFHRLLDKDEALRAEWEELQEGRKLLAGWKVEERVPSFVLVEGEEAERAPARAGGSWLQRFRDSVRSLGAGPAWGLATAAAALFAFVLADMRFQSRLEQELAARLPDSRPALNAAPAAADDPLAGLGRGQSVEPVGPGRATIVPQDPGSEIRQVSSKGSFLTQDDLSTYNSELMTTLVDLLNQYDARRADEVSGLVQALYERVNSQQVFDYRQVNNRIDAVGAELLLQKDRHERTLDQLLGPARVNGDSGQAPTTDREE